MDADGREEGIRGGYGTIIPVGDLAVLWPGESKFTRQIVRHLDDLDLRFIFVDGNHDVHPKLRALPRKWTGSGLSATG